MRTLFNTAMAAAAGMMALGASAALAGDGDRKHRKGKGYDRGHEIVCDYSRDRRGKRVNHADCYDSYGKKRNSGLSFTIRIGDGYYDSDYGYRDGYYRDGYRDGYRRGDRHYRADHRYKNRYNDRRRGRLVNKEVFDTRYRARIVLTEEVVRNRRGYKRLVCTVHARGPEAEYVSKRRLNRIAKRNCSPRARIRVYT